MNLWRGVNWISQSCRSLMLTPLLLTTIGTGLVTVAVPTSPVGASTVVPGTTGNPGTTSGDPVDNPLSVITSRQLKGGYVAAGVAMRNLGYGTISLTGLPAGSTVYAAYLLWDVLDNSATSADGQGSFDGSPITGVSIGTGDTPCWNSTTTSNYAYEANVTSLVTGDGTYDLSGFASGVTNGEDPWFVGSPAPESEGASLVVIYENASSPSTTVQLYGGATETQSENLLNQTLSGFTVGSSPTAQTTFIVGDGQGLGSNGTFNGTTLISNFMGGDPQAVPSYSSGNLWDTDTFNVSSLVNPGDTTETATVEGSYDCIVWVGQVFSVTSAAAVMVTSVSPDAGPATGGTQVTITGQGFIIGSTAFNFGPNPATDVFCSSSTSCTAESPSGSGDVDVIAVVNDNASLKNPPSDLFYYLGPIVGVQNVTTFQSAKVTANGVCVAPPTPIVSHCFTLQQNFYIDTPSQSGPVSYWAQNVLYFGESLNGRELAIVNYKVFRACPTCGNHEEQYGPISTPFGSIGPFTLPCPTCTPGFELVAQFTSTACLPTGIATSLVNLTFVQQSEIVKSDLQLQSYLGSQQLMGVPVFLNLPTGSFISAVSSIHLPVLGGTKTVPAAPELDLVGAPNNPVQFGSGTQGEPVISKVMFAGQSNWAPAVTETGLAYGNTQTGELSTGLVWSPTGGSTVSNNSGVIASFSACATASTCANDQGIEFG